MSFEFFLALRYLRVRRGRRGAAGLTALAAVVGIACGVGALVVALALANGFRDELQDKILRGTAHLTVARADGGSIENHRELVARVRGVEGVVDASATSYAGALVSGDGGGADYAVLRGVDVESERALGEIQKTLVAGRVEELRDGGTTKERAAEATRTRTNEAAGDAGARPLPPESFVVPVIVGVELGERTGLRRVGDEGMIVQAGENLSGLSGSSGSDARAPELSPLARRVRVVGVFRSGLYDYDSSWVYVPLGGVAAEGARGGATAAGAAQARFDGSRASAISVEVDDIYETGGAAERVRASLGGSGWTIVDWRAANRPLFAALELERRVVAAIIALVMVVAALNITATLALVVVERRADIAILGALGAEPRSVMKIFVVEGAIIGALGALAGVALGLAACVLANRFELIKLPPDVYSLSGVTLRPHASEVLAVALAALLVSLLATIHPARSAARVRPAEALRDK